MCPLTLREEQALRMFGNKVFSTTVALKRGEVRGGWRKIISGHCKITGMMFLAHIF
jgi:hypothetical protein